MKDLRDTLKLIDIDANNRLAFIEYLLFKYNKTVQELFTANPNQALLAALERAIAQYRAVFEEKKKREQQVCI